MAKKENKKGAQKGNTSKAEVKALEIQEKNKKDKRLLDEIWAIIIIALGCFFAVSVFTDGAGKVGEFFNNALKGLFGVIGYVTPIYFIVFGILLIAKRTSHFSLKTFILLFIMLLMICTANSIGYVDTDNPVKVLEFSKYYQEGIEQTSGGYLGMLISSALLIWIGKSGCWIFIIVATLICILLIFNTPLSRFFSNIHDKIEKRRLMKENAHLDDEVDEPNYEEIKPNHEEIKIVNSNVITEDVPEEKPVPLSEIKPLTETQKNNILSYVSDDNLFGETKKSGSYGLEEKRESIKGFGIADVDNVEEDIDDFKTQIVEQENIKPSNVDTKIAPTNEIKVNSNEEVKYEYKLPPISLLNKPTKGTTTANNILNENARILEDTLKSFNVDAKVVQITQGPTVTRYELKPSVGVKVSNIESLADDIALSLAAKSLRIEAPIPGKSVVGIEIENSKTNMVSIREVLDTPEFKNSKSKLSVALGKDISGAPIIADIAKFPHVLIAGATGSGKSVCINTIISSLLFKAKPDEVKLILIDPKKGVELGKYNGIPYLRTPVVTEAKQAVAALNWAVAEMMHRYECFAVVGARDFETYNEKVRFNGEPEKVIPNIVIIIDELADLMTTAKAQIEEAIQRLTQLARAAGMYVVLATQRPSVNVITGVIKCNVPSKIAFAVGSQTDSRVIIDMNGAEKLVGKGDMLYNPGGTKPIRVQGAFISDDEVYRVIEYSKKQKYNELQSLEPVSFDHDTSSVSGSTEDPDGDEYLAEAISYVVQAKKASTSMIQRRFRIGYNRAARIIDIMEEKGIVGPADGSRPREVLLTNEELEELENSNNEE